jgi:hypothetical protein
MKKEKKLSTLVFALKTTHIKKKQKPKSSYCVLEMGLLVPMDISTNEFKSLDLGDLDAMVGQEHLVEFYKCIGNIVYRNEPIVMQLRGARGKSTVSALIAQLAEENNVGNAYFSDPSIRPSNGHPFIMHFLDNVPPFLVFHQPRFSMIVASNDARIIPEARLFELTRLPVFSYTSNLELLKSKCMLAINM